MPGKGIYDSPEAGFSAEIFCNFEIKLSINKLFLNPPSKYDAGQSESDHMIPIV